MVNFFKNLVQKTSNLDNFCRKYFHWRNRTLGSNPSGVAEQQRNGFHLSAVKLKLTTNQRLLQKNTLIYFTPTLSAAKKSSNKNVIYLALYQQLLYPSPFAFDFDEIFDQKKSGKFDSAMCLSLRVKLLGLANQNIFFKSFLSWLMCSTQKGFVMIVPLKAAIDSQRFRFWLPGVQFDSMVCIPPQSWAPHGV